MTFSSSGRFSRCCGIRKTGQDKVFKFAAVFPSVLPNAHSLFHGATVKEANWNFENTELIVESLTWSGNTTYFSGNRSPNRLDPLQLRRIQKGRMKVVAKEWSESWFEWFFRKPSPSVTFPRIPYEFSDSSAAPTVLFPSYHAKVRGVKKWI